MNKMSFQKNQFIPLSQQQDQSPTIRRRLPSISLKSVNNYSSQATSWALRRSKSVSSMGETAGNSIMKWWRWGWDWILSRKPTFALDLEMSDKENEGSFRHVFFKVSSQIRRIVGGDDGEAKFGGKYDSVGSYFKSFDSRRNKLPY